MREQKTSTGRAIPNWPDVLAPMLVIDHVNEALAEGLASDASSQDCFDAGFGFGKGSDADADSERVAAGEQRPEVTLDSPLPARSKSTTSSMTVRLLSSAKSM